jgi:monoamine oxidase
VSDVIVVGAGLSGLVCARRLVERGVSVTVVEARDRVGGRLHSVPFAGGVIDLGGHIMTATQYRLAALAEELGVESAIASREGKPRYPRGGLWAALATWRAVRRIDRLRARQVDDVGSRHLDAAVQPATTDAATLATYLEARIRHPVARERIAMHAALTLAADPGDIDFVAYLDRLARTGGFAPDGTELPGGGRERYFPSGAQQLATKLADGLHVQLSTKPRSLEELDAKRIVLAIPPVAMRDFVASDFIANTHVGSVVKVFVAFDQPYWRDAGWSGEIYRPAGTVRATFATGPVITVFVVGRDAARWGARDPAERRADVLATIAGEFGPREPVDYREMDWTGEGGCVASTRPFVPVSREPHGRVHLAGTETASVWPGYMEGAIESGERAAAEVLEAL